MTFTGGTGVLRVSPSDGSLEIAPTGPYIMNLTSASTMSEIVFVQGSESEYTMQSAGCVPTILSGTGDAGAFYDYQWNGSATDLQITMTENSPSFTAIQVLYGATLIQAMEPTLDYDETIHMLTLTTSTEGASIYYTLDGSEPTTSSTLYEGPLYLTSNVYLRAIAGGDNYESSGIIEFQNSDFTATPVTFYYDSNTRLMTLMTETEGATIYYSRDGSAAIDTTIVDNVYTEPFLINSAGDFAAVATMTPR